MRLLLLVTSLILSGAANAAENVTTFSLRNGMDVVVIEDHRAPVVTHMVWYRVGAADELPGKSGIAHLLEHLMFKGTKNLEPGEFSRIVSANGGSENAFTSFDYTGYFQRVAADRLELMMRMEADRMQGLVLSEEDVVTERDVVLEERNSRTESNPGSLFSEQRMAALYLNHPYGIPIIGWKHEIAALTRDDAFEFYKKYYAPNNAILIVAGDVDPKEVHAMAQEYYGELRPSDSIVERVRPSEPPQIAPRRLEYKDNRVSQPYVIRTYLAPERNSGDQKTAAALALLSDLLGGDGINSVFGRKLQIEQKTALHVSAFYDGLSYDKSGFGLVVVPVEGISLPEAEAAMDTAVADFMIEGVDEDHLARIKAQIKASETYRQDSVRGRARAYGEALTSGLTVADADAWPEVLQAITAEDIMMAAQDIFDLNKSVTGYLKRADPEAKQ